jgi:hypothetical protein
VPYGINSIDSPITVGSTSLKLGARCTLAVMEISGAKVVCVAKGVNKNGNVETQDDTMGDEFGNISTK